MGLGTTDFHAAFLELAILVTKFVLASTSEKFKYQNLFLINTNLVIKPEVPSWLPFSTNKWEKVWVI